MSNKIKKCDFLSNLSSEERNAIAEGLTQEDKGKINTLKSVINESSAICKFRLKQKKLISYYLFCS